MSTKIQLVKYILFVTFAIYSNSLHAEVIEIPLPGGVDIDPIDLSDPLAGGPRNPSTHPFPLDHPKNPLGSIIPRNVPNNPWSFPTKTPSIWSGGITLNSKPMGSLDPLHCSCKPKTPRRGKVPGNKILGLLGFLSIPNNWNNAEGNPFVFVFTQGLDFTFVGSFANGAVVPRPSFFQIYIIDPNTNEKVLIYLGPFMDKESIKLAKYEAWQQLYSQPCNQNKPPEEIFTATKIPPPPYVTPYTGPSVYYEDWERKYLYGID